MTRDYDHEFGPDGTSAWPACPDVAEKLVEAAPYAKSGPDCLNDDFFYDYLDCLDKHLFLNYPEEEAEKLAEEAAKGRQELFRDARNWPLPYLVASATYKMLSTRPHGIRMWSRILWPFLCFDEPLFDMLRVKGWGKIYKNDMREGFKSQLRFEIDENRLMWGSDEGKPWFTRQFLTSHIYPGDVLRCLELVDIDPGLAHSAVDQAFKLQSLIPLYDVLSDDPSSMLATVVHRSEEGGTGSPKKPSWAFGLRAMLIGVGASPSAMREGKASWVFALQAMLKAPPTPSAMPTTAGLRTPLVTVVTTSASQRPHSRPLKKMIANLSKLKVSRIPSFIKTDERIRIQNTKKSGGFVMRCKVRHCKVNDLKINQVVSLQNSHNP